MMVKKRYLVLILGIVCVLLGSVIYSVTQAQKLHSYKGSVIIPVLRRRAALSSLSSPPQLPIDLVLPFCFSPEGQLSNITDMWITFSITTFTAVHVWHTFNLTLNDQAVTSASFYAMASYNLFTVHLESSFREGMVQGINILKLSDPFIEGGVEDYFEIAYVDCFIEYEYQAR